MTPHAFRSRRVVLPDAVEPATVLVDPLSGKVLRVAAYDEPPHPDAVVSDFGDDALLPGLVDAHVHINSPGRDHWEGSRTATRAAAAGGLTTVIDMPLNNLPETTTVAALGAKRAASQGLMHVDWRPWGGAVNGNAAHLLPLAEGGVAGFKCFLIYPGCDGLGLIDEAHLVEAMPRIAATGLPLLVHAELDAPLLAAAEALGSATDWTRYETYLRSRPDTAETEAVALMLRLVRRFGTRVHIVHVSSAEVLPLLQEARAEGLPVTAETCPHYLYFASEAIPDGATEFKCAPPIRSEANRQALWQALLDGTLDLIASDHSPCPPEMKNLPALGGDGSFRTAWGGIASLSVSLPAVWTALCALPPDTRTPLLTEPHAAVHHGLRHIARWMAEAPARLAALEGVKGRIAPGYDADFVVFSPEAQWLVTPERLHFRHPVSPYVGQTLKGEVRQTILRGRTVYRAGEFPNTGYGREVPA